MFSPAFVLQVCWVVLMLINNLSADSIATFGEGVGDAYDTSGVDAGYVYQDEPDIPAEHTEEYLDLYPFLKLVDCIWNYVFLLYFTFA